MHHHQGADYDLQPTVKFYGTESQRHITILEGEQAKLPLRLTGDAVGLLSQ